MKKQEFEEIVKNLIIPLFTGSELEGEEASSIRDAEVAQGTGGTILCKPSKNDEYRLIIKREQPFKKFEVQLVRAILEELGNVSKYNITESAYKKSLQLYALEKAICKSVSDKSAETLLALVVELSLWGSKTYEGSRPTFGFIVLPRNVSDKKQAPVHFSKILSRDFSTMISDGKNGVMLINPKGNLISYYNLPNISEQNLYAPYEYMRLAKACSKGRVGIALADNGDILIFSEGELVFAKRRGSWASYSHDEIIQKISDKTNPMLQEAVYLTTLDVSFAGTGACICYLKRDQEKQAIKHIDLYDILTEKEYDEKVNQLKEKATEQLNIDNLVQNGKIDELEAFQIPESFNEFLLSEKAIKCASLIKIINGKRFYELDRKLRADLLGIDGATIIDHDGSIVSIGAIIEIEAGSSGGGRLAAAKTLGKYGVSMKVSMDSTIIGFAYDSKKGKVRTLFFI